MDRAVQKLVDDDFRRKNLIRKLKKKEKKNKNLVQDHFILNHEQRWFSLIILPRFSYQNECLWVSHHSLFSKDDSALHQFTESYRFCTSNINPCFAILICEYCRIMHFLPPPHTQYLRPLWLYKVTTRSLSLSHNRRIKTPPGMLLDHIQKGKIIFSQFLLFFVFFSLFCLTGRSPGLTISQW